MFSSIVYFLPLIYFLFHAKKQRWLSALSFVCQFFAENLPAGKGRGGKSFFFPSEKCFKATDAQFYFAS
jgi:hypothetical protein